MQLLQCGVREKGNNVTYVIDLLYMYCGHQCEPQSSNIAIKDP